MFHLPSVATLKMAMRNINIQPGFSSEILTALEKKLASRSENSKLICLMFDEMSIKEALSYDSKHDLSEGLGQKMDIWNTLANHAFSKPCLRMCGSNQ